MDKVQSFFPQFDLSRRVCQLNLREQESHYKIRTIPIQTFHENALHRDGHRDAGYDDVEQDPDDHLGDLRVREQVQPELDVEDELGEGDADEDPGLAAQPLALLVGDVGVVLPGEKRYMIKEKLFIGQELFTLLKVRP